MIEQETHLTFYKIGEKKEKLAQDYPGNEINGLADKNPTDVGNDEYKHYFFCLFKSSSNRKRSAVRG